MNFVVENYRRKKKIGVTDEVELSKRFKERGYDGRDLKSFGV